MTTEKQRRNLKRGGASATPESAARARAGKARIKADDERLAEMALGDPWGAYEELHSVMTKHMVQLLRDEQRAKQKPSREVTDRLREYRQTTETLSTYRATNRSVLDDAAGFFAELDRRLATLLGEDYPDRVSVSPLDE